MSIFFRLALFLALLFSLSGSLRNPCAAQEENPIWIFEILVLQNQNLPLEIGERYFVFDKKQFEEIMSSERVAAQKITETLLQSAIQSMELDASLQGFCLEGQGRFRVRNTIFSLRKPGETFSIPIQPLGFWLTEPKTSTGEKLSFGSVGNTIFLNFPPTFQVSDEKNGFVAIDFQWTLRGEREGREKLIFNISSPQVPRSEWTLRLPSQWGPPISEGIVQEIPLETTAQSRTQTSPNRNSSLRTWKISPNGQSPTFLTIYSSESTTAALPTLPIRQTLTYDLLPDGLNVKSVVSLTNEKELRSTGFVVTLDKPLRLKSVLWGNQSLTTTAVNEEIESDTCSYHVTVPSGEGRLVVNASGPLQTDQTWNLPRIRLQSPQHFWMETKTDLFVKEPLVVYTLEPNQAIQTETTDGSAGAERRYSFQYFTPDSEIAINMMLDSPGLVVKTGTLLLWEEEQITSTMCLDLTPVRQNAQVVELQIQPGWSIDRESLESVPKESLLLWEGDSNFPGVIVPSPIGQTSEAPSKSLFFILQKPTKLKLTGSRPNLNFTELPLGDFLPVRVNLSEKSREIGKSGPGLSSDSATGRHLVALTANPPNHLKLVGIAEQIPVSLSNSDPEVRKFFFSDVDLTAASVFVLDANSRTIPVCLEHQKLRFESKIESRLTLQDRELVQTCTFFCSPSGRRLEGLCVHWTQESSVPWTWTIRGSDGIQSSRILSEQERQAANLSTPPWGIVEEVRLATPRSGSFFLEATRRITLERPTTIPLPMLPESVLNPVEVIIDSLYLTGVEIVNTGLQSIPVNAPLKNEYQTVRAAFRYNPLRDIGSLDDPLLFLVPLKNDETTEKMAMVSPNTLNSTAWVWTLQLDSQFESTGLVREHATFFIENRGQKRITITLPPTIPLENVLAVTLEDERVTYDSQKKSDSLETPVQISLMLPAKRRFLTVSLEYWHQSLPLFYRSKIRPFYPSIDLPVLGGTWIAWTPPEFQTFLRGRQEGVLISEKDNNGVFYLLSGLGNSLQSDPVRPTTFLQSIDPFSLVEWGGWFSSEDREKNCLPVAIRFIETLGNESGLKKLLKGVLVSESKSTMNTEETPVPLPDGVFASGTEPITWGEMLSHPDFRETVFGESAKRETPSIFIDWIALQRVGLFPVTPIRFFSESSDRIAGHRVLESTGLSLVFLNERSLLITSTLNAAKYQWGLRPLFGDRVKVMRDGPLANRFREAINGTLFPQWISLEAWNNQTSSQIHPWGNISPSSQIASTAVSWNALELRRSESEHGIYVAHRPTLVALHCFAFLFCVMVSRWKPFSSLVVLLIAAIIFGGLSMGLPLYYTVMPLGAFFGTLFGLAFALVRREVPKKTGQARSQQNALPPLSEDSTDAEYEVRELRPFHNTSHSTTTRREESFFDMLENK